MKTRIALYVSANPGCSVREVREFIAPYSWQEQVKAHKVLKVMIEEKLIANWGPKHRNKLYLVGRVLNFPVVECPF